MAAKFKDKFGTCAATIAHTVMILMNSLLVPLSLRSRELYQLPDLESYSVRLLIAVSFLERLGPSIIVEQTTRSFSSPSRKAVIIPREVST